MGAVLFLADPVVNYYLETNTEKGEFGLISEVAWNDNFSPPEVGSVIIVPGRKIKGRMVKVRVLSIKEGEEETTAGKRKCLNIMVRAI